MLITQLESRGKVGIAEKDRKIAKKFEKSVDKRW